MDTTITFPLRSPREIETAAAFVAELKRQGLNLQAKVERNELTITVGGH